MSARKPGDLTRVGRIISESMDRGYLGLAREMVRVFGVWEEAVGAYNASKAVPESIKNGRLTVLVESPVWIDRFSYLKPDFIRNVNEALGAPMVNEIVFRVGGAGDRVDAKQPAAGEASGEKSARPKDSPAIEAAVAGIKDPDLRERLAGLLARQRSPRKE